MGSLKDGWNELGGPGELVEIRDGVPVRFSSLSRDVPGEAQARAIAARIEALTGRRVRMEAWEVEEGDPRDGGINARIVVV
jgi:hypothetical protein